MPTVEERALALVNEVRAERSHPPIYSSFIDRANYSFFEALCREIETLDAERAAHAQFRQEVSDRVEAFNKRWTGAGESHSDFMSLFSRFILPKPVDPLVEAIREASVSDADDGDASRLRAALAKRGLKLVEVGDAD